jgi:hypothetical protein
MDKINSMIGDPSVHTEAANERMTTTVESLELAVVGVLQNTNVTKTAANDRLLMILSAAPNNVGGSHKGPANATAGGGRSATTRSDTSTIRKGTSVFSDG